MLAFLVLVHVAVSCCWMQQTDAFVPNSLYRLGLNIFSFQLSDESLTHKDITKEAILQVAADVLKNNPNPDPEVDSTTRLDKLTTDQLTTGKLMEAYFGGSSRDRRKKFDKAIAEINDANEDVDLKEEEVIAAAHFDSEQFQAGQNRLVQLRQMVIDEIIKAKDYKAARRQAGRMLHTLQDFYSHSNWIEMGNMAPYSVLGSPGQNPENIASPSLKTCDNCIQDGRVLLGLGSFFGVTAMYYYRCNNNIRGEINQNKILTSGYYTGQVDSQGRDLPKPLGKCSHGGFIDSSSDLPATGGINKDSAVTSWGYHADLHHEAAQIAIEATVEILQDIRQEVKNDTKFAAFLNIDLIEQIFASIAYVIDTTGSMGEELPQIQATIPNIRVMLENYVASLGGKAAVKFILVPFNDPDPGITFVTEDIEQFLSAIAALYPDGGGDCPEPSVGAVIRAIQASVDGSPIYVFTDASASDASRVGELQALITEKGTSVNYVLTGTCSKRKRSAHSQQTQQRWRRQTSSEGDLYEFIAAFSGGQVLDVEPSDISELSAVISLSIETSFTTVLYMTGISSYSGTLYFPVDETVSEVVISLNGFSIGVTVTTPEGTNPGSLDPNVYQVELQSTTSYIATINVSDAILYGLWQLDFSSVGSYSIQISALSDLTFTYRLYQLDPNSHFGFSAVEGKPLEGESLILLVETAGDIQRTSFDQATLRDANGEVIQNLNLTTYGNGTYVSLFMPPAELFQLQILGMDSSGNLISRISSSGVQVSDVNLRLGQNTSQYNSLFPGDTINVTVVLYNFGEPSNFSLEIAVNNATAPFNHTINPDYVSLEGNATVEIIVTVVASENSTDGEQVLYTITASSVNTFDGRNDFTTFEVFSSTAPPPNITENIYTEFEPDAAPEERVSILLSILLAATICLLFI